MPLVGKFATWQPSTMFALAAGFGVSIAKAATLTHHLASRCGCQLLPYSVPFFCRAKTLRGKFRRSVSHGGEMLQADESVSINKNDVEK